MELGNLNMDARFQDFDVSVDGPNFCRPPPHARPSADRPFPRQNLRHSIKGFTVDRLKHIITGFGESCGVPLAKSGKKQELIDRITKEMEKMRYKTEADKWDKARAVIYQVKNTGGYVV